MATGLPSRQWTTAGARALRRGSRHASNGVSASAVTEDPAKSTAVDRPGLSSIQVS